MDFITKLPRLSYGYDTIWVIVDRLTKLAHFMAIHKDYNMENLSRLYINKIVARHGVPEMVQGTIDKVVIIKERFKAARDRQKSYADNSGNTSSLAVAKYTSSGNSFALTVDKSGLDASVKLTQAKLNKHFRDADLLKDKSGPESPPEFQRSLYVKGYVRGPTEPVLQTPPSMAFIKENIDVLRTMIKERDYQAKMKATPRKLAYADSDKDASARREKLPQNINVYEGYKDLEDHLVLRVLSQKFLEEFSQQKRYAKDPTEIHGIKRRQNESLQAFIDQFKSKSLYIKGVPPVLHISAFMHGHGHPKLAKKLNEKIPKTVNKMFERVRAFIKGEVAARSAEMKIEEVVASGKLAHLVKDIRWNNQRIGNQGRNGVKVINIIREEEIVRGLLKKEGLKPQYQHLVKTQKVRDSDDRFFWRNISSPGNNRSSSNYGKGREKEALRECKHMEKGTRSMKGDLYDVSKTRRDKRPLPNFEEYDVSTSMIRRDIKRGPYSKKSPICRILHRPIWRINEFLDLMNRRPKLSFRHANQEIKKEDVKKFPRERKLISSCFVIFDLEPLSLSFDFVFSSEIFKSLSFCLDRLLPPCDLCQLNLSQHSFLITLISIIPKDDYF
nr:reverse transcriptase domain-containing protein [Tanacetum cinerariifolium]